MAWTYEKETGDIVITFPNGEGTAAGPFDGLGKLVGVNLDTPGEISAGYTFTANATSGATLGPVIARSTCWYTTYTSATPSGSPSRFAVLDVNGRVWESSSVTGTFTFLSDNATQTGATALDGLGYYLGYLFKTRGANIDYWNGTTWTNAWQSTLTGSTKHFIYAASDNGLYITNSNWLASVTLTSPSNPSSFVPGTGSTFNFSVTKLQLPASDVAFSIGEVGGGNTPQSTLLVGGIQNAVYPWDKTSSSFNYPIFVAESFIWNIVSANQNAFIFAGVKSLTGSSTFGQSRGRIYITNGSQAEVYFKFPDYITNRQSPYYAWGDAVFHRNNLVFGCSPLTNDTSTTAISGWREIFAIDFDTKSFRSICQPSTASGKGLVTALLPTYNLSAAGFGLIACVDDLSSAASIGNLGSAAGIGGGTIITDTMKIGTFLKKRTFKQVEVKLRAPLESGESVTVLALDDNNSQSNMTFEPSLTATGTQFAISKNINFQASEQLRFQIGLTGNSATSGCRLYEIRLR